MPSAPNRADGIAIDAAASTNIDQYPLVCGYETNDPPEHVFGKWGPPEVHVVGSTEVYTQSRMDTNDGYMEAHVILTIP